MVKQDDDEAVRLARAIDQRVAVLGRPRRFLADLRGRFTEAEIDVLLRGETDLEVRDGCANRCDNCVMGLGSERLDAVGRPPGM